MGFRTVVVLNNDQAHEWENDPALGHQIWMAACTSGRKDQGIHALRYGQVVEQVHADTQTLAVLDGYGGKPLAYTHWYHNQTDNDRNLALLKALADQLGYRVSKKSIKEDK